MIGTQQIGGGYSLLQMAQETKDMNSRIIKCRYHDEGVEEVLSDPYFMYYFIWYRSHGKNFVSGVVDTETEYRETFEYVSMLLSKFKGTGKTFFIGNWEGDWYLLPKKDKSIDAPPERTNGMVKWINIRYKALCDARDSVKSDVKVYYYIEMNRVTDAYEHGLKRIVNEVLPQVTTDFISLSSWELQEKPTEYIAKIFDYINSYACYSGSSPPGLTPGRIFIGECGIPSVRFNYDGIKHRDANKDIFNKFKTLGCPFVLYWAMHNNEFKPDGRPKGLWLIDDNEEKTPLYEFFKTSLLENS